MLWTPKRIGKLLNISLPDMEKHTKTEQARKHAKSAKIKVQQSFGPKKYRQTVKNIPTPWAHGPMGPWAPWAL